MLDHVDCCRHPEKFDDPIDEGKKRSSDERIIPVMGLEAFFRFDRFDKEALPYPMFAHHLCIHARNLDGWRTLMRLSSKSWVRTENGGGFYSKPCIDMAMLEEDNEGIAISSACIASPIAHFIMQGDEKGAIRLVKKYQRITDGNFWLELMPHDFDDQRTYNIGIVNIAQETSSPLLATGDVHIPYKNWKDTHSIVRMAAYKTSVSNQEKKKDAGEEIYTEEIDSVFLSSGNELYKMFCKYQPDLPSSVVKESLANTFEFAKSIKWFVVGKATKAPKVDVDAEAAVRKWVDEGWEKKLETYPKKHWDRWSKEIYVKRREMEWDVLKEKGVLDYFYIVGDFVRWAKSNDGLPELDARGKLRRDKRGRIVYEGKKRPIRVGLGRGSAAGCLISHDIGITAIDPISHKLKFERFLNPDRVGYPDIDMDFETGDIVITTDDDRNLDGRDAIKEYCKRMHGKDHVADIIAYQTFAPRAVIKAVGGALDIPFSKLHKVTESIGETERDLRKIIAGKADQPGNDIVQKFSEDFPEAWKHILRLEDQILRDTRHAGGIVITPRETNHYMPTQLGIDEITTVTAWADRADFPVVSDNGFLKYDLLGVKGLLKQELAVQLIKDYYGEEVEPNDLPFLRDPYDIDQSIMDAFTNGLTALVFQFGGRGITSLLRHIKPENTIDISVANALYRPGPIKIAFEYGDRKKDSSKIKYWHDALEPILGETLGLMCVHEDTRIMTTYGLEVPIKELRDGDEVFALNEKNYFENKIVEGVGPTRFENGIKLTIGNGEELILTDDHKVLTSEGMIRADELQIDDLVSVAVHSPFPKNRYKKLLADWLGSDINVAWFLGQIAGDGCKAKNTVLATGTQEQTDSVINRLSWSLPHLEVVPYFNTRSWYLSIKSDTLHNEVYSTKRGNRAKALRTLICDMDLDGYAKDKRIPWEIRARGGSVIDSFVAGLFEADGHMSVKDYTVGYVSFCSISKDMLDDLMGYFRSRGIIASRYPNRVVVFSVRRFYETIVHHLSSKKPTSNLYLATGDTVGFVPKTWIREKWLKSGLEQRDWCKRADISRGCLNDSRPMCDSLTAFKSQIDLGDIRYYKVRAIERVEDQQFYGMGIRDIHNFVANGVVVSNCFQEQAMEVVQALGNFTGGQADSMRKAMSKLYRLPGDKAQEFMAQFKEQWMKGCHENGLREEDGESIWTDRMLPLGNYLFNRSHSSSYGLQACQDMWLKTNYPKAFYAAGLTVEKKGKPEEQRQFIATVLREAAVFDIKALPPDVNISGIRWSVDDEGIRYGLAAVKNLGKGSAEKIVENRPYEDYRDLAVKSPIDAGGMLSLAKAGAFDTTDDRKFLLAITNNREHYIHKTKILMECGCKKTKTVKLNPDEDEAKTDQLIEDVVLALRCKKHPDADVKEYEIETDEYEVARFIKEHPDMKPNIISEPTDIELNEMEQEVLNISLSQSQLLLKYKKFIDARIWTELELHALADKLPRKGKLHDLFCGCYDCQKSACVIGGEIVNVKKIVTKNNDEMAFVELAYGINNYSCTFFPAMYKKYKHLLDRPTVFFVGGFKDKSRGQLQVMINNMADVLEVAAEEGWKPKENKRRKSTVQIGLSRFISDHRKATSAC